MKFSIIIPNLDSPIIDRTIEALSRQWIQSDQFEVIVVGMDGPGLIRESTSVRFIGTDKPVSPARARNIGAGMARGEIACFLDADCIPSRGWLSCVEGWFADPNVAVLGGGVECRDSNVWIICDHLSSFHDYLVSSKAGVRQQLPSLNLAIRRTAFEHVAGFDERYPRASGEDSDLTTRLRQAGFTLHFDPQLVVTHMPARRSARAVIVHAWQRGRYSIKVDPRWREFLHTPLPLRHRGLLILCAPLLALKVTLGIFAIDRSLLRWWYTAPLIWILKMAWCAGASQALQVYRRQGSFQREPT
jgi:cellulose synthase/poly-beta-1,6-N-acetylglucosamine synthase-like glycosyltransferase